MSKALASYLPIIVIVIVFYFLVLRPGQKRQKDRAALMNSLQQGDKVVTIGGIHGTVAAMETGTVLLSVADEVQILFERSAISKVVEKAGSINQL